MMSEPSAGYEFSVPANKDHCQILMYLEDNCERWIFQKERNPKDNSEYYQCKVEFIQLVKLEKIEALLKKKFGVTECRPIDSEEFYTMKGDKRIEGPWTDKD